MSRKWKDQHEMGGFPNYSSGGQALWKSLPTRRIVGIYTVALRTYRTSDRGSFITYVVDLQARRRDKDGEEEERKLADCK
jgi:hypothetical protein